MPDQAERLRRLVAATPRAASARLARSLVFTSGKGGVGTSNLALNLALALGARGHRVTLVDADFGLANLDLLCGVTPACDLGDVLAGGRPLADAILTGPHGVRILAGAHGTRTMADLLAEAPRRLVAEMAAIEADSEYLLIDAGSGLGPSIAALAEAADGAVLVTTPEPTSIADAHAALKRLGGARSLRLAVTQARSRAEGAECLDRLAASSRQFLGLVATPLGLVRFDPLVPRAVRSREPFLTAYPSSAASRDVRRMAKMLRAERVPKSSRMGLFATLAARWSRRREAG
jgi:flagellar biosynthesis protein FlhG